MKYLKNFETEAGYASYKNGSDYILPNVSYVEDIKMVYYNPFLKEPQYVPSPNVVIVYNVTDISQPTFICNDYSNFSTMIVDGVETPVADKHQFNSIGEHKIEFILIDNTKLVYSTFNNCETIIRAEIPETITNISTIFYNAAVNGGTLVVNCNIPNGGDGMMGAPGGLSYGGFDKLIIGDSVKSIGSYAFYTRSSATYKPKFKSIIFGSSLESIGNNAFCLYDIADNTTIELIFKGMAAPSVSANPIVNIDYYVDANHVLKCPKNSDYSSWVEYLSQNSKANWTVEYI